MIDGLRKQYHFQPNPDGAGKLAWDVHRLIERASALQVTQVPIATFDKLLDTVHWFDAHHEFTVRAVMEHAKLIEDADLSYAIILGADGRVMDGMHRICKAVADGREWIDAVQFDEDPPPDYVGVEPDVLPYD